MFNAHVHSLAGHPPVKSEDMKLPDHAGEKMSLWAMIKFFFFLIPKLPAMIRNSPSVAIKRVKDVSNALHSQCPSLSGFAVSFMPRSRRRRNTKRLVLWGRIPGALPAPPR